MWFWLLMIALTVLSLVGAVFQRFFWLSMIASGVLVAFGSLIEILWYWRQDIASGRERKEEDVANGFPAVRPGVQNPPKRPTTRTGDSLLGTPSGSMTEASSLKSTNSP